MEATIQEYLRFHGLHVCPGHGVSYKLGSDYCHMVSPEASESQIGYKIRDHIRLRCRNNGKENSIPASAERLGQCVKLALCANSCNHPCSVESKTQLLYYCGCKHVQPMRSDHFRGHIHAKGNEHKCQLSVWGKSELEKKVFEANAFAFCGVRCSRAKCGRWVIRSKAEPDMAKLSYYLRGLSTTSVVTENLAESNIEENTGAFQPAAMMEVEASSEVEDSATSAEAESEATATCTGTATITQSTKPVILLLGFTFRKETNADRPTYEKLLGEARSYYGKANTQLPGAIRDKARIVRLHDAGFDCFCVSKSNKDENDESKHYYGDFCDRKFVQELREKLHKHPVQICVDWVWCPIGWDTTHYLKPQFFTKTLPDIASLLSSDAIEVNYQRITRKRRKDEKVVPSGVIFLPFTLGILTELFKALDALGRQYTVSFLDREQLMVEHPMFAATASIPDSDIKLLNKKPRPEDGYATELFKNIDAGATSNIDARQFKSYVMSNCSTETRMIKLSLKDGS